MTEAKYDNDPFRYEEILNAAGWKVFQRDEAYFYFAHEPTGRMIAVYTDHEPLASRTDEENQNFDRGWACYQFFNWVGETTEEQFIKRKLSQEEYSS
jgi:hypothetical protein